MKQISLQILFITSAITTSWCQTSKSEVTGYYMVAGHWAGGIIPGSLSAGTISVSGKTVTIDGTTIAKYNLSLSLSTINVNAGDTLVVWGDMTLGTSTLNNNGVVVVYGNFINSAGSSITNASGRLVVTGNYTNAIGVLNTFTGASYTYGTKTGFIIAPALSNEAALSSGDPSLYSFVNAMHGALPVQLVSWTVTETESGVLTSWITTMEKNCDYFVIERSIDGRSFNIVGQVTGHGNTTLEQKYQWVDHALMFGTHYYRLKQVDFDGHSYTYSTLVVTSEKKLFTVYPNPTADLLNVSGCDGCTIVIQDVSGVLRYSGVASQAGMTIDVSSYEAGLYHAVVSSAEGKSVCRFVKE